MQTNTKTTDELLKEATARPWRWQYSASHFCEIQDEKGRWIAESKGPHGDDSLQYFPETESEMLATAELICRAVNSFEAMDLALRMIAAGIARIERSGTLQEFCFDGIRYCINGDWAGLFSMIGLARARKALELSEGKAVQS